MESIMYLQERYAAPHIERVAVQNKRMSKEETQKIVESLKAKGLISMKPVTRDVLNDQQRADARKRLLAGEKPGAIARDLFVDRDLIRGLQYKLYR